VNPRPVYKDSVGLCQDCCHAKWIENERGSRFILCNLSKTDPTFPKYPRLPVVACSGYRKIEDPAEPSSK
jgi:hypothetical protein